MTYIDAVAAHRPYGLDCKCGRPINSDKDWATHFIEALALTEETGCFVTTPDGRSRLEGVTHSGRVVELVERYPERFQLASRLVGPWVTQGEQSGA